MSVEQRCPSYRESKKRVKKGRDQLWVSVEQRCASTSKTNQRWNRFQSLLRFGVDVKKRFKSKHVWTEIFFKNGETKSPF